MNRRIIILLLLAAVALPACTLPEFGSRGTETVPVERLEGARLQREPGGEEVESGGGPAPTAAARALQPTALPTAPPAAVLTAQTILEFPFSVQTGSPALTGNFINPGAGCNWLGVAGQVFDQSGRPLPGLIVEVGGRLNGRQIGPLVSMTGSAPALGPGGYALNLSSTAADSTDSLYIQVNNLDGAPQTRRFFFDTSSACDQNLVVINFVEEAEIAYVLNMPLIHRIHSPFSLTLPLIHR